MIENLQNQTPTTPDSLLLSPEDLATKQAKWRQEGYTEEEVTELTSHLQDLSTIRDFEKDFIAKGEVYWKEHPEELKEAEHMRKDYEAEKKWKAERREQLRNDLARRQGQPVEAEQENLEGRDEPKKGKPRVFNNINGIGVLFSTGVLESGGFKVGDRVRFKGGWPPFDFSKEINPLATLRVVGFDDKGRVIIQADGGGVFSSGGDAENNNTVVKWG